MTYTIAERNNAILLIANGEADFTNTVFYERLQEFNWIVITKVNATITSAELTYAGKDLLRRLLKKNKLL